MLRPDQLKLRAEAVASKVQSMRQRAKERLGNEATFEPDRIEEFEVVELLAEMAHLLANVAQRVL